MNDFDYAMPISEKNISNTKNSQSARDRNFAAEPIYTLSLCFNFKGFQLIRQSESQVEERV